MIKAAVEEDGRPLDVQSLETVVLWLEGSR